MKKSILTPLLFVAVFVMIVGSACGFSIGKNGDDTETQEPQVIVVTATPEAVFVVPTEAPATEAVVTEAPATEAAVTEEAYADAQPYFFDDFDSGDLSNYSYEILGPGSENEDLVDIFTEDGYLKFNINGADLYPWVYYDPYTYEDVRIDLQVENLATSDNSVQLICRYDENLGWYEYDIENDGEWYLWYHDSVVAKDYIMLYDGGSTAINMGRDTNKYTMICKGRELTLYINDVFVKTFEHKDLKEGAIAFGGSSYGSYPVMLNFDWLEVSEP